MYYDQTCFKVLKSVFYFFLATSSKKLCISTFFFFIAIFGLAGAPLCRLVRTKFFTSKESKFYTLSPWIAFTSGNTRSQGRSHSGRPWEPDKKSEKLPYLGIFFLMHLYLELYFL